VAVHQFRKRGCSDWYDGHPDHTDGGGLYEARTLYTSPPAQRKPLDAGEISRLWKQHTNEDGPHHNPYDDDGLGFARAIEALAALAEQPAPVQAAYKDSTPHLSVGESSFESWYDQYLLSAPVHQENKQRLRDAYAAGMGDPLVVAAPAQRKPLTAREIELIDGMIEVQLDHAARCDNIANRVMAEKQKGWDMERVELLRKLKENT
jgi:hypothetical protein